MVIIFISTIVVLKQNFILPNNQIYGNIQNSIAQEMGESFNYDSSYKAGHNETIDEFRKIFSNFGPNLPMSFFDKYYDKLGPETMLSILNENKFCHSEAHGLGRTIYAKTNDISKSLTICGYKCSAGCMHGVFMEIFKDYRDNQSKYYDGHTKIDTKKIDEFVINFCSKTEIKKFIYEGNCYHALGHAFLFIADYNISQGLELCRMLNREASVYYCATGVYMEYNFMSYSGKSTNKSYFSPCETKEFPAACFRYKVFMLFNKGENLDLVKKKCSDLPRPQRLGCFHGIGYAHIYFISSNPKLISKVCKDNSVENRKVCIDAAIQLLSIYNRNASLIACNYVSSDLKNYCLQEVIYSTFNMNKPLDLYYFDKEVK